MGKGGLKEGEKSCSLKLEGGGAGERKRKRKMQRAKN